MLFPTLSKIPYNGNISFNVCILTFNDKYIWPKKNIIESFNGFVNNQPPSNSILKDRD